MSCCHPSVAPITRMEPVRLRVYRAGLALEVEPSSERDAWDPGQHHRVAHRPSRAPVSAHARQT